MAPRETATGLAPKPIAIAVEASAVSASIQVTPGVFQISKGKNEQVEWACAQSGFIVDFGNDSPFNFSQFQSQDGKPISSGPIRSDLQPPGDKHLFKYSVTVGGNVLDPQGQVDK